MLAFPYAKKDQNLFFVAEIGGNHNQNEDRLIALINSAKSAGFDAVKLQYYNPDKLWSDGFEEQREAARAMTLPADLLQSASIHCKNIGISLGCSVFDLEVVEAVAKQVNFLKIASYECMWFDLIKKCRMQGKPLFISTGMCNMVEINSIAMKAWPRKEDAIFHCSALYPSTIENCKIDFINKIYRLDQYSNIGYSDHTVEPAVLFRAIGLGANIIEMHFDLDGMQGAESKIANHCWSRALCKITISDLRKFNYLLKIDPIREDEREDRKNAHLRADPEDGMRPMKLFRNREI